MDWLDDSVDVTDVETVLDGDEDTVEVSDELTDDEAVALTVDVKEELTDDVTLEDALELTVLVWLLVAVDVAVDRRHSGKSPV